MAIATTIKSTVGGQMYGPPSESQQADIRRVQGLLRRALGPTAPRMSDGTCCDGTRAAIAAFEQAVGVAGNGVVSQNGATLAYLDRLANPLVLNPIAPARVLERFRDTTRTSDGGGYSIGFQTFDKGRLPAVMPGYSLHLAVGDSANTMEIPARNPRDVMSVENLGQLLTLIDRIHAWGGVPVPVTLQVRRGSAIVSESNMQLLTTPVMPHNGRLLPLDESANGPKLTYQGDPDAKDFHGRMFATVPGFDRLVFMYAGIIETRNEFRGFDCITYVGAVCGAPNDRMSGSELLAGAVGAQSVTAEVWRPDEKQKGANKLVTVTLDAAAPADVKEFFSSNPPGYYLMFSAGHIVIVHDGWVHEFKASAPSGYARTPVLKWLEPYKSMKLNVRKLPGKPLRAL